VAVKAEKPKVSTEVIEDYLWIMRILDELREAARKRRMRDVRSRLEEAERVAEDMFRGGQIPRSRYMKLRKQFRDIREWMRRRDWKFIREEAENTTTTLAEIIMGKLGIAKRELAPYPSFLKALPPYPVRQWLIKAVYPEEADEYLESVEHRERQLGRPLLPWEEIEEFRRFRGF